MTQGHTRVATGTVGGQRWSVWAKTGPASPPSSVLLPGTTFFISQLPRSACSYRELSIRVGATQGPAWSGSQRSTFGTCQPNLLMPATRDGASWGPGIGN